MANYLLSSGSGAVVLGFTALQVQRGVEPGAAYDHAIELFEEHLRTVGSDTWDPDDLRQVVVDLAR